MEMDREEPEIHNMFLDVNSSFNWCVPTGLKKLDQFLRGGFLRGAICQIFGEAGTGKSQLAMQFMLGASLHSCNTFLISTDKIFHLQRFNQLKEHYEKHNKVQIHQRWQIEQCTSSIKFEEVFLRFQHMCQSQKVDLLIIDNIYRVIVDRMAEMESLGKTDIYFKARMQKTFVNTLREIAKKKKIAVVLINNASAVINDKYQKWGSQDVKAALSQSWDSEMDENIRVSKLDQNRKIKMLFSVKAPTQEIGFSIEKDKGFMV